MQLKAQAEWLQSEIDILAASLTGGSSAESTKASLFRDVAQMQEFFDTGKLSWKQSSAVFCVSDECVENVYTSSPQAVLPVDYAQAGLDADRASSPVAPNAAPATAGTYAMQPHAQTMSDHAPAALAAALPGCASGTLCSISHTSGTPPAAVPPSTADTRRPRLPYYAAGAAGSSAVDNSSGQRTFPADLVPPVNPPMAGGGAGSGSSGSTPATSVLQLSSTLQSGVSDAVLKKLDRPPGFAGLPLMAPGHVDAGSSSGRSLLDGGLLPPLPRSLLNNGATTSAYSNGSEQDGFLVGHGMVGKSLFDFGSDTRKTASSPPTREGSWDRNTWAMQRSTTASEVASSYRGRPLLPGMAASVGACDN